MRKFIFFLILALALGTPSAEAQRRGGKARAAQKAPEPTPEELEAMAREAALQERIDELLSTTREVTFIDSLVVDKDAFLGHLRLSPDAGRFSDPATLFADHDAGIATGRAAFTNPLASAVYFSMADSTGRTVLQAAYRNGLQWGTPQDLPGTEGFDYQDYPFVLSDGITLFFAAEGPESIGGLDIFATRYSNETHQYVRPENVGFPFNSTANDYLLAVDESIGIGVLVTDRRQPDDKVCLYWFVARDQYPAIDFYDPDDEDVIADVRRIASIASIADSQHEADADIIADVRSRWESYLASDAAADAAAERFIVNDATVYTALSQFVSDEARSAASRWQQLTAQYADLTDDLDAARRDYALTRSQKTAQRILNLEVQTAQLRPAIHAAALLFRQHENAALLDRHVH